MVSLGILMFSLALSVVTFYWLIIRERRDEV